MLQLRTRTARLAGPTTALWLAAILVAGGCSRAPQAEKPQSAPAQRFGLFAASEAAKPGYRDARVQMRDERVYCAPAPVITGADVSDVRVQQDAQGRSQVLVTFTPAGRTRLAEFTRNHLKERLAIVVDGRVLLAPVIENEIAHGAVLITGAFTAQEFERIAKAIRSQ
jgi:preprotein translocase subunit SecD